MLAELQQLTAQGQPVIALVGRQPYVLAVSDAPCGYRSPHGPLATTPGRIIELPLHAVVVVGDDPDRRELLLLDPWYPADGQPVRLRYQDVPNVFGGDLLV